MTPPTVIVTAPEFARGAEVFHHTTRARCVEAPSEEDALADAIVSSDARLAIVGHSPYRARLYEALPRGGVLARFGVGFDGIDTARATAAGLLCTNTPGVLDQSVAELAIALILAAARHVPAMAQDMVVGRWQQRQGIELAGKTLAIAGAGRIGAAVAKIAVHGFGMRAVAFSRDPRGPSVGRDLYASVTTDFETAVRDADFVSLHIPARPENARFLDGDRLRALAPHAWLINTARGAVVDERAMFEALSAGRLAGAALDVFEQEPYIPIDDAHDLRTLPNVILLPHVGSHTADANRGMASRALENVLLGNAGETSRMDLINPAVLEAR